LAAADLRNPPLRHAPFDNLQAAGDALEQIVEIMRDAAGELSHRFHLLRLAQRFLGSGQRLGGFSLSRDVAAEAVDRVVFGHG
jgi:hypothetical protein